MSLRRGSKRGRGKKGSGDEEDSYDVAARERESGETKVGVRHEKETRYDRSRVWVWTFLVTERQKLKGEVNSASSSRGLEA